jgi:hypothetical protein
MSIATTRAIAIESATVGSSAVGLSHWGFSAAAIDEADRAYVCANSGGVWYTRTAGATPSSTRGLLLPALETIEIVGNENIRAFSAIRRGDSDARVTIELEG